MAKEKVDELKKEAGRINSLELQKSVSIFFFFRWQWCYHLSTLIDIQTYIKTDIICLYNSYYQKIFLYKQI